MVDPLTTPDDGSDSQNQNVSDEPPDSASKVVLTELESSFVTLMVQHYMLNTSLPTVEAAEEDYGFTAEEFTSLLAKHHIIEALEQFGVNLGGYKRLEDGTVRPTWQHKSLSALQLLTANQLLDLQDTRSHRKKLQELGVHTRTYNAWLRDPVFSSYLRDRAEAMLGDRQHDVHLALIDQATSGNIKAIEYFNELVGRYIKQPERVLTQSANNFDATAFIVRVIEVLTDEISDPQEAQRIAERLREIASQQSIAQGLAPVGTITATGAVVNEYGIEVPQTVAVRELEGNLKTMTDAGAGMSHE